MNNNENTFTNNKKRKRYMSNHTHILYNIYVIIVIRALNIVQKQKAINKQRNQWSDQWDGRWILEVV